MQRVTSAPRENWQRKVEEIGFDWHTSQETPGNFTPYWDETAHWVLTAAEVDLLEEATNIVHDMCLQATQRVIDERLYGAIGYPDTVADLVEASWAKRKSTDLSLYGRFDFAFPGLAHGDETPKLLEYNADTPTGLFEASVVQWHWLQDCFPESDQFNSIHEALVARWAALKGDVQALHLTSMAPHAEDEGTVRYLQDAAIEAGYATKVIAADNIGWAAGEGGGEFVDLQEQRIDMLYKLLPWDWILSDPFGEQLAQASIANAIRVVEPAWKLIASSKGILPILWDMFPNHPFLLEAQFEAAAFKNGGKVFAKPKLGREGANVSLAQLGAGGVITGAPLHQVDGPYGREGYIYQAAAALAQSDGHHAVIGSWVIGDTSHGIGLREDVSPITRNTSRFVPHRFE